MPYLKRKGIRVGGFRSSPLKGSSEVRRLRTSSCRCTESESGTLATLVGFSSTEVGTPGSRALRDHRSLLLK
jgi:hypothetical protein